METPFLQECVTTIILIYLDPVHMILQGKSHTVAILPQFSKYLEVQTVVVTYHKSHVSMPHLDSWKRSGGYVETGRIWIPPIESKAINHHKPTKMGWGPGGCGDDQG